MMGSIANNRFLQRVNPEITRALADSGSSLNHSEIQQLARNMVDLGLWGNLKLWVHSGLVKTRASGGNTFVSKAYDISSNDNDAAQATEANQPKLVSLGMEFDGSNDTLEKIHSSLNITNNLSVLVWAYISDIDDTNFKGLVTKCNSGSTISYFITPTYSGIIVGTSGNGSWGPSAQKQYYYPPPSGSLANFLMFVMTYSSGTLKGYINGEEVTPDKWTDNAGSSIYSSDTSPVVLGRWKINSYYFNGKIGEVRIINTVLTDPQITSIFNASKAYYGL